MATNFAFRWEFRAANQREAIYAEGELEEVGGPGDKNYLLKIYLVHDEMALPDEANPLLDPSRRVGRRIYVTTVRSREEDQVRLLAYLAPVEGHRLAYTLIFNALRHNVDKVEEFGFDWLTKLMHETPKKAVRKKAVTS